MVLTLEHTLTIDLRIWKELRTQEGQHNLKGAGKGSVISPWCQDSHQLQLTVWKPMIMSRAAGRLGSVPSTHRLLERWAQHHLQGFLRVKQRTRLISSKVLEQSQGSESGRTLITAHVDIQNTDNTMTCKYSSGGKPEWGNHRLGKHSSCFSSILKLYLSPPSSTKQN